MADDLEYTPSELMAVAGARELKDGQIVAVGLGLPVVAAFLARRTHAPNMTILFELGVVDPEPVAPGVGLADPRVWYRATMLSTFADMLGAVLHRGLVDVGFLGGLEIDAYGNLNTTLLAEPGGTFRHFVGSGGANDIASLARETIIIIRHEARKIKERISYITSPGYLAGSDSRKDAGLTGGPRRVITDKAIFGFDDETRRLRLLSIHPGITLEEVLANMACEPVVPAEVGVTEPPTAAQVRLIREEIDPHGMYTG
ncbi:MAG: CoA-transferase [Anaerolineae bacterium]|nr:CoA-transferase [Anaerolineae bacterium]